MNPVNFNNYAKKMDINSRNITTTYKTVFVGDLSFFCREVHLFNLFHSFGSVEAIRIRKGQQGVTLMYGFVELETPELAMTAANSVNGMIFMGRRLRAQVCSPDGPLNEYSKKEGFQVHFSFISTPPEDQHVITEDILRRVFERFGEVEDISIKKYMIKKLNRHSGYGFVYYYDRNCAELCIQHLKNNEIDGILFDCSISHSMSKGGDNQSAEISLRESAIEAMSQPLAASIPSPLHSVSPYYTNNSSYVSRDTPIISIPQMNSAAPSQLSPSNIYAQNRSYPAAQTGFNTSHPQMYTGMPPPPPMMYSAPMQPMQPMQRVPYPLDMQGMQVPPGWTIQQPYVSSSPTYWYNTSTSSSPHSVNTPLSLHSGRAQSKPSPTNNQQSYPRGNVQGQLPPF